MGFRPRENLTMEQEMEQERCLTYEALLMQASDRWATSREIEQVSGQSDLTSVLDGLVNLRELEITMFDDDVPCYRLTEFGHAFAVGIILSG